MDDLKFGSSDSHCYLDFRYLTCVLSDIPYEHWQDRGNYSKLTDNEQQLYHQHYPREGKAMMGFAQRYTEQGLGKGLSKDSHRALWMVNGRC